MLLAACQPTFNWRVVRTDPAPLQALMPCKPEQAERSGVPMTESGVTLRLWSCEAGGLRFVLAAAQLTAADDAEAAWQRWHQASQQSWQVVAPSAPVPAPPGSAPGLRASWQGSGRDHQGRALPLRAVYLAQGGWVYQAFVAGQARSAEPADTFFSSFQGLGLPPVPRQP